MNKFIVVEGLDRAGKTSAINKLLKKIKDKKIIYQRGFVPNNLLGRCLKRMPSTLSFALGLLYISSFIIKPALKDGETIIKERYIESLESYLPNSKRIINRIIIKITKRL